MPDNNVKCRVHKKYKAKFQPRSTEKFPGGCAECWGVYNEKNPVRNYVCTPGGVKQPVVTTTGDFAEILREAVKDKFGT